MGGLIPFNKNRFNLKTNSFEDFYNMLDDFFNDTRTMGKNLFNDTFKIDVRETEKQYLIEAELPGIKKEEVNLDLNDNKLSIAIIREENIDQQKKGYIHKERKVSSMQRSIYLQDAKAEGASASLEDGILKIEILKEETSGNSYKIDIK